MLLHEPSFLLVTPVPLMIPLEKAGLRNHPLALPFVKSFSQASAAIAKSCADLAMFLPRIRFLLGPLYPMLMPRTSTSNAISSHNTSA